jgi:hypothetical protein
MNRQFSFILLAGLTILPLRAQMHIIGCPINQGAVTVTCSPGSQVIGILDPYSQTCHASGGSGVYSWAVSGMPHSFSKSAVDGSDSMTITGIPYKMETDTMIVTAIDSTKPPLTGTSTITVVVQAGLRSTASPW